MDLREYMTVLKDRSFKHCGDLKYNQNDKDMGYRSGLRFLGIARTAETDEIADEMIYGKQHKHSVVVPRQNVQLELFA